MRWTGERAVHTCRESDGRFQGQIVEYAFARDYVAAQVVLDVGCGDGHGSSVLAEVAREVTGVDVSAEAIRHARERYPLPNLRFLTMSGTALEFPDTYFDTVTSFQVIEHLLDPGPYVLEIARVLRRNGLCIITTPNRLRSIGENPYHVHEFSPDELRAALQEAFGDVTVLGYHGNEKVQAHWRLRERTVRFLLAFDVVGLRRRLPRPVILRVYPWLYRMSRTVRMTVAWLRGYPRTLSLEDFSVSGERVEEALSLIAVCRDPRKIG